MYKGIYDFFKPHPFLPTFHAVRGGEIGIGESVKLPQTRAHKKYPTYIQRFKEQSVRTQFLELLPISNFRYLV